MQFPLDRIQEYPSNPRIHDGAVEKMAGIIREFGFRVPVLLKSDGLLCDGHLRVKAARMLGMTEVPAICADDMTEDQITAFRLAVNRSANFASWDYDLLLIELDKLQNFDLSLTGFDAAELAELETFSGGAKGETSNLGNLLSKKTLFVKAVLPMACLEVFERAIMRTGLVNRADAVRVICERYLDEEG
jgi:hypothetical protein